MNDLAPNKGGEGGKTGGTTSKGALTSEAGPSGATTNKASGGEAATNEAVTGGAIGEWKLKDINMYITIQFQYQVYKLLFTYFNFQFTMLYEGIWMIHS